jgi:hypothetical protein
MQAFFAMHVLFTSTILRQTFNSSRDQSYEIPTIELSWLYIDVGMSQQNIHVEAKELYFMVCNMILFYVVIFKSVRTFP